VNPFGFQQPAFGGFQQPAFGGFQPGFGGFPFGAAPTVGGFADRNMDGIPDVLEGGLP